MAYRLKYNFKKNDSDLQYFLKYFFCNDCSL